MPAWRTETGPDVSLLEPSNGAVNSQLIPMPLTISSLAPTRPIASGRNPWTSSAFGIAAAPAKDWEPPYVGILLSFPRDNSVSEQYVSGNYDGASTHHVVELRLRASLEQKDAFKFSAVLSSSCKTPTLSPSATSRIPWCRANRGHFVQQHPRSLVSFGMGLWEGTTVSDGR